MFFPLSLILGLDSVLRYFCIGCAIDLESFSSSCLFFLGSSTAQEEGEQAELFVCKARHHV